MHRSSESIAALAAALAKAQMALTNPEKSLTGTLPAAGPTSPAGRSAMRRCPPASTSSAKSWASMRLRRYRRPSSTRTSRRCRSRPCLPIRQGSGSLPTGQCAHFQRWHRRAGWARRSHTPGVTRCLRWSELPGRMTSMRRTSPVSQATERRGQITAPIVNSSTEVARLGTAT